MTSEETYKTTVEHIREVEDNGEYKLGELTREPLQERLVNGLGFHIERESEGKKYEASLFKEISPTVYLYLYFDTKNNSISIGFWSKNELTKDITIEELMQVLDGITPEAYFDKATNWGNPNKWLLKRFFIRKYGKTLPEAVEYIYRRLKFLEEKIKAQLVLEAKKI
jgi:hypothetical protein